MYHLSAWCLQRPEENFGASRRGCESPCGSWELNPSSRKVASALESSGACKFFFFLNRLFLFCPPVAEQLCHFRVMSNFLFLQWLDLLPLLVPLICLNWLYSVHHNLRVKAYFSLSNFFCFVLSKLKYASCSTDDGQ